MAASKVTVLLPLLGNAGCVVDDAQCYVDSSSRILGNENVAHGASISLKYCAQLCADRNFSKAGTESGGECYCGNKFNVATPLRGTGCSVPCNGNLSENCGGSWRMTVYDVACSGPPPKMPPMMINPCLDDTQAFAYMPFCNASLPLDDRVADAISRMTITEKIGALGSDTPAIPSLGLSRYNWWSEAATGVVGSGRRTPTTKFPFPITTAMSFNRSLWRAVGRQIGREGRAMMNAGNGFSTFWAPVVNLARDPRWGRNIETPGEDPYLTGEYAEHFVQGFQEAPEDPGHLQASACCKHYVANEMESTTQPDGEHWDRNHVDSNVSMQDLVDTYMRPFQACVEKGRVSSLMCSYNALNGVPSCANNWLLQTVARNNWGFDGYITSDCDADADVYRAHHYAATPEEAVQAVLRAGTDVDCWHFVPEHAQSALDKGMITQDDIDARLRMLFRVRMRLAHFDPEGPLQQIPESDICSHYAIELSLDSTRQSATLLKNEAALPLDIRSVGTVAVIGPNADLSRSDSGYYGPDDVCGGHFWTLVDALSRGNTVETVTTHGVPDPESVDESGIAAAVSMAESVDTVVLAVGTDLAWAAEGQDAKSIAFSTAQQALILRVAAAARKPLVLVLMTATPLDLSFLLSNAKVGAVLHLGQPSVTVLGVSELLYGEVSPSGRMIQTVYPATYQDEISIFDFHMRPGPSDFARPDCTNQNSSQCPKGINPGRTYRFYTKEPVVPFGYGLSYATFEYAVVAAPSVVTLRPLQELLERTEALGFTFIRTEHMEEAEARGGWRAKMHYAVNVTNNGNIDADDVVLGFIEPPGAGKNGAPLKYLFDFERVHIRAGETATVHLYPSLTDFALVGHDGKLVATSGEYRVNFGVPETHAKGMGYAQAKVSLTSFAEIVA